MRKMAFFRLLPYFVRRPVDSGGAAAIERDREIVLCIQNRAERTKVGRENGGFLDGGKTEGLKDI